MLNSCILHKLEITLSISAQGVKGLFSLKLTFSLCCLLGFFFFLTQINSKNAYVSNSFYYNKWQK